MVVQSKKDSRVLFKICLQLNDLNEDFSICTPIYTLLLYVLGYPRNFDIEMNVLLVVGGSMDPFSILFFLNHQQNINTMYRHMPSGLGLILGFGWELVCTC